MTPEELERILGRFPRLRVCVVGDLFLDRYLDIDPALSETSLETGLEAHQVTDVRCYPGAAGTVAANLVALGIGQVAVLTLVGEDGEGHDLRQALRQTGIDDSWLRTMPRFRTPTYTKPLVHDRGGPRELSRLDIKNRRPLDSEAEEWLIQHLEQAVASFDAIVVSDQVQERNCGVITDRLRARLGEVAPAWPKVVFAADSRSRIGEFRALITKPNLTEAVAALGADAQQRTPDDLAKVALRLAARMGCAVYLTLGEQGLLVAGGDRAYHVPGYRVAGKVDVVGAGDSTMAGIVSTLCAGGTLRQAGLMGCLVASITVQRVGVTGTASPASVRRRFAEYRQQHSEDSAR